MENLELDFVNKLDETTWLDIFEYLDGQNLIILSITCEKFRELIGNSRVLMRKIKFSINFPEESGEELKKIKKGLETCSKYLTRNYLNLQIKRLKDKILNKDMRDIFMSIISQFAVTVTSLEINNCYLLRDDIVTILQSFKNLVELKLENLAFSDDLMPSEIVQLNQSSQSISCPKLKTLHLIQCDFYCLLLLRSHDSLHTLEISMASYNRSDVEKLEDFLLKQSNLKDFKLTHFRFNSSYSSNRLSKIPFQLEKLYLKDVYWDIKDHCSLFLESQKKLKHLELKRIRQWILPKESNYRWFCDIMKHVLIYNRLEKLVIDTSLSSAYMKDCDFLVDVCNKNVKHLTYIRDSSDTSELFLIFARLFPNSQTIVFIDFPQERSSSLDIIGNLNLFKDLKDLSITTKPGSLANFPQTTAENLTAFYFYATNEDKSLERLKQIFSGKSKIQHFGINIESLTVEEIIELIVHFSSTLKKLSIMDLYLNQTEAELFIRNFPNLRYLTSDMSISQDVLNILKDHNITFNKCNGKKN
ncbi:hypothetical protein ACKWTF_001666 [Chironomus riparius]